MKKYILILLFWLATINHQGNSMENSANRYQRYTLPDNVRDSIASVDAIWSKNKDVLDNVLNNIAKKFIPLELGNISLDCLIEINYRLLPTDDPWRTSAIIEPIGDPRNFESWGHLYLSSFELLWLRKKIEKHSSLENFLRLRAETESESSAESYLNHPIIKKITIFCNQTTTAQDNARIAVEEMISLLLVTQLINNNPTRIIFDCYLKLLSEQPFKYYNNLTAHIFMNILLVKFGYHPLEYTEADYYNQYQSTLRDYPYSDSDYHYDTLQKRLSYSEQIETKQSTYEEETDLSESFSRKSRSLSLSGLSPRTWGSRSRSKEKEKILNTQRASVSPERTESASCEESPRPKGQYFSKKSSQKITTFLRGGEK